MDESIDFIISLLGFICPRHAIKTSNYFPRLVSMGYLSKQDVEDALGSVLELEMLPYATLCCPLMVEVIAEK